MNLSWMVNRSVAPQIFENFKVQLPRVNSITLTNGTRLHHFSSGNHGVIKLEILFPYGGSYYEKNKGSSFFVQKMLFEGTEKYTQSEISYKLSQLGITYDISPGFDSASISFFCLNHLIGKSLPVLLEVLTKPIFPTDNIELLKTMQIQLLKIQNEKNNIVASKLFRSNLYGCEHPYGSIVEEDDINCLNRESLLEEYTRFNQFEILLSGSIEASIFKQIQSLDISKTISIEQKKYTYNRAKNNIQSVDLKKSFQTSLKIGNTVVGKKHSDYMNLLITNHLIGGFFGSRLMKSIREKEGLTYGIYSSIVSNKHNSHFAISTEVKKSLKEQSVEKILNELNRVEYELCSNEEITLLKNHLFGSFTNSLTSPFAVMSKFKGIYLHDLDYTYYDNYWQTIDSITSPIIKETASKYLRTESCIQVSVG